MVVAVWLTVLDTDTDVVVLGVKVRVKVSEFVAVMVDGWVRVIVLEIVDVTETVYDGTAVALPGCIFKA